jgi:hypothetical protein
VWEAGVINEAFDPRTLARMNLALARVCENAINGETHAVRKCVAGQIIKCASSGKTTLDELVTAGQRAVARMAHPSSNLGRRASSAARRQAR